MELNHYRFSTPTVAGLIAKVMVSDGYQVRLQKADMFTDASKDDIFKLAKKIKEYKEANSGNK